jgi:serine/threonine protein kinase/Flp pilus assembly protein TadD
MLRPSSRDYELFAAALLRPTYERDAFLVESCADDRTLLEEMRRLLAAHAREEDNPLFRPLVSLPPALEDPRVGQLIGPYRLQRLLGTGGMGSVYLAVNEAATHPVRVAVKLLHTTITNEVYRARFRQEGVCLAKINSVFVARLLDSGTTESSEPYLVTEYVDGMPLGAYCDAHRLCVDDRIRLFQKVCQAVQFVHAHMILHNDLKPGNILVTDEGTPKLLDFGVSKLLNPDDRLLEQVATKPWMPQGTPQYMSPERRRGEERASTASDVYSLGVILFELLTGLRPTRVSDLAQSANLREQTAAPPLPCEAFLALMSMGQPPKDPRKIAAQRGTTPRGLLRKLRGELEVIVVKALAPDAAERYASPQELHDELGRWIEHDPIRAIRLTPWYKARKLWQRHRVAALLAVALIAAGLFGSRWFESRKEAKRQAATATETIEFFARDILGAIEDGDLRDGDIMMSEVLDAASAELDRGNLSRQPKAEAPFRWWIGKVYLIMARYGDAERHAREALRICQASPVVNTALSFRSRLLLASALRNQAQLVEAETIYRAAVAIAEQDANELTPQDTLAARSGLAAILCNLGKLREAESTYRAILNGYSTNPEDVDEGVNDVRNNLGIVLQKLGEFNEARRCFDESLSWERTRLGPRHPKVAATLQNLADVERGLGKYEDAEQRLREALEICLERYGERHDRVAEVQNSLGLTLRSQGRREEAAVFFRQALKTVRSLHAQNHPRVTIAMSLLASCLTSSEEELEESVELLSEAVDIMRKAPAGLPSNLAKALTSLAMKQFALGRSAEAEVTMREALSILRAAHGAAHPEVAQALHSLGTVVFRAARYDEAAKYAEEALAMRKELYPEGNPLLADSFMLMGTIAEVKENYREAAAAIEEAFRMRAALWGGDNKWTTNARLRLAQALRKAGSYEDAERHLLAMIRASEKGVVGSDTASDAAIEELVKLYEVMQRPDDVEKWRRRLEFSTEAAEAEPNKSK